MPGGGVLAGADLVHPAERRDGVLARRRLRQGVQKPEPGEGGEGGMLRLEDVAEGVGALVAEVSRVGELADAEGITDDYDRARFHVP
jgi:hypothetical protein